MLRKIVFVCILAITAFALANEAFAAEKPRVAVYGFETKASGGIFHDAKWDIGTGLGEMLVDALVATGKFTVLERLDIGDVTFEQDLVSGGRVSKKTGAKTGQMLGADYLIRGALTEFQLRESGGGVGFNIKGFNLGVSQVSAHIAGIIRVYDATTGEIYTSERFEKSVPASGVNISYQNLKHQVGGGLSSFKQTPLGEATHFAIKDMVDFISAKIPSEPVRPMVKCQKCGAEVKASTEFCPKCGTRIAAPLENCPSCGVEVSPNEKFCASCGAALTEKECPKCKAKVQPGKKFCPECGTKL